mgnify:CR=1 FL=1
MVGVGVLVTFQSLTQYGLRTRARSFPPVSLLSRIESKTLAAVATLTTSALESLTSIMPKTRSAPEGGAGQVRRGLGMKSNRTEAVRESTEGGGHFC